MSMSKKNKIYTRKDLRKQFVVNLMFYEERNCINCQLTTNKSDVVFDRWNMRSFGRQLANSDLLDKKNKDGFVDLCEAFLNSLNKGLPTQVGK